MSDDSSAIDANHLRLALHHAALTENNARRSEAVRIRRFVGEIEQAPDEGD